MRRLCSVFVAITVATSFSAAIAETKFEHPVRLMVGDEPMNTSARQMYPSPAWYDVDNDGKVELVVGDISGSINVYENSNDGKGDPVWEKHKPLESADGERIRVSNW